MTDAVVTQNYVEVLTQMDNPPAEVTQVFVEVLRSTTDSGGGGGGGQNTQTIVIIV